MPVNHENRIRERYAEILVSGKGDGDMMDLESARDIAYSESLTVIIDQAGDHISKTNPELAHFIENYEEKPCQYP